MNEGEIQKLSLPHYSVRIPGAVCAGGIMDNGLESRFPIPDEFVIFANAQKYLLTIKSNVIFFNNKTL